MSKYINYLILCCTVLLYCCGEKNHIPENNKSTNNSNTIFSSTPHIENNLTNNSNTIFSSTPHIENNLTNNSNTIQTGSSQINTNQNTILTNDEQQKFDSLIQALKDTNNYLKNTQNHWPISEENKFNEFVTWISNHLDKQKELANAFTNVYNFLEEKRNKKANNINLNMYIKDALECKDTTTNLKIGDVIPDKCNIDHKYGSYANNDIEQFFRGALMEIVYKSSTHEEIFDYLKAELLDPNNHVAGLTTNWTE